jgi:hypothetical protein
MSMSKVSCTECLDRGSYWTEGVKSVAYMESQGLTVLDDGESDPDGTVLIRCPHCLPPLPKCTKCGAYAAMNCSIEGCPNGVR